MSENYPQSKHRRIWWRLWIYPTFQIRLLLLNATLMGAVFLMIGLLCYNSHENLRSQATASGMQPGDPYFQFLLLQYQKFIDYLIVALFLSVGFTSLVTLLLSHRLAGPILRLRSFFTKMIEKDGALPPEKIKFRDGDFFSELPEIINRALEKLVSKQKK